MERFTLSRFRWNCAINALQTYNLCCKSTHAFKHLFRERVPEAVAGLLEEMRATDNPAHYHPEVLYCTCFKRGHTLNLRCPCGKIPTLLRYVQILSPWLKSRLNTISTYIAAGVTVDSLLVRHILHLKHRLDCVIRCTRK